MTGRELINYILENRLEDAGIDNLEDITFEVPVQQVFIYKEDTVDILEYKPYSKSIWHVTDGDRIAELLSEEEAQMIRGEDSNSWRYGIYDYCKEEIEKLKAELSTYKEENK